jgi:hypothetical protein
LDGATPLFPTEDPMREFTIKHAIVCVLSLLLASAESFAIVTTPPAARGARRLQQSAIVSGTLAEASTGTHYLPFARGREHRVVAVCEGRCDALTLELFSPSGRVLDRNASGARLPEVATIPSSTGRYRVDVTTSRCESARCTYSLVVFSR